MKMVLSLCMISSLLLFGGCGKKKEDTKKMAAVAQADSKKLAKAGDAYLENVEDESDAFAFVDDEAERADKVEEKAIDLAANEAEVAVAQNEAGFKEVIFEFNKNQMKANQDANLQEDITLAKGAIEQGKKVVVQGHGCQMGDPGFNLSLSVKRAQAIKNEMVKSGLPEDKIDVAGFGQEKPKVFTDATSREDKIKALEPNRRAEIAVS